MGGSVGVSDHAHFKKITMWGPRVIVKRPAKPPEAWGSIDVRNKEL